MAACADADGRAEIQAGFQAFRLCEPERAEGRRGPHGRARGLRQFQPGRGRREGPARKRRLPRLRDAHRRLAGRGVHGLRPARRGDEIPRRLFLRHLSPARRSALARRATGDVGGRGVLLRRLQTPLAPLRFLLPARRQGGEDGRARGDLHLRSARQPRIAADRGSVLRASETLVGGHDARRPQARHLADHARSPSRFRPLSAEERVRPAHGRL